MVKKVQSPLVVLMAIRGVKQQDIADVLGVHVQTVKNWMSGRTVCRLTIEEWEALATLLGTTIDHLPKSFAPQPIDSHVIES